MNCTVHGSSIIDYLVLFYIRLIVLDFQQNLSGISINLSQIEIGMIHKEEKVVKIKEKNN